VSDRMTRLQRRPRILGALAIAALVVAILPVVGRAADPDYPPGDSGYHSYPEVAAELAALERAHPEILHVRAIGRTAEGRPILLAKITDGANDPADEGEPEVLVDGLHHAREHLSAEAALDLVRFLVERYGESSPVGRRVTRLVDERVIWVVPMLDPDGLAYDLSAPVRPWGPGGASWYAAWRKNRQPIPGSSAVGLDLNRTWGYRWGCCGGSSGIPASENYRGTRPWQAPEVRVLRDFVLSRIVDGRQRIRTHASLHTTGELVLYPWAYTRADRGPEMTRLDLSAFRLLARRMAAQAGYRAMQSSAMYPTDGDMIDWMYARQRIHSFTLELSPARGAIATSDRYYLPDERLPGLLRRPRAALLTLIEAAGCPWSLTRAASQWCGTFADDLEGGSGWTVDPAGTDDATVGIWRRADPRPDGLQPGRVRSGRDALVTGPAPDDPVRDGTTSVRSPTFLIPAEGTTTVRLAWWLGLGAGTGPGDGLTIRIVAEDPAIEPQVLLAVAGNGSPRVARLRNLAIALDPRFAGERVALELIAYAAPGSGSLEAGVDDVRVATEPESAG